MGKRKREDGTDSDDIECPISVCYGRISKHRSCWIHVVACLYARGNKIGKQRVNELWRTSPCFSGTFPCRRRSERRRRRINRNRNTIARAVRPKDHGGKLNSAAFDCYFENMWRTFSEDKRTSFGYLDSLWFNLYMKASLKGKVLGWIKKKQIFSKKYVLVPIVCWSHWSLLIFCHLGESSNSKNRTPCMLLLDSLEMANPRRLEPDIRKFLLDIYRSEGRAEGKELIYKIPLLVPKVPQQRDGEECGNYVLYYINLFVQDAPGDFSIECYPYFMKGDWFSPESLKHFLEEMKPLDE